MCCACTGPSSPSPANDEPEHPVSPWVHCPSVEICQQGNHLDIVRNDVFDGTDLGWSVIGDDDDRLGVPGAMPVTTHLVDEAIVLDEAGEHGSDPQRADDNGDG